MAKQDFFMRMIEQLRGILPYILDLTRNGNYDEAHALIDQAVRRLVGLGPDGLLNLADEVIVDRLQQGNDGAWEDKLLFLTAVLFEQGNTLAAQGEEAAAYGRYLKTLHFLLRLAAAWEEPMPDIELVPDIEAVVAKLDAYHLPSHTCIALLHYYDQLGDLTAVENLLFDWLENTPETLQAIGESPAWVGLEILQRWLQQPEAAVVEAGLSLEEVQLAITDLQEMGYTA